VSEQIIRPSLEISRISDPYARANFERLQEYLIAESQLNGFVHMQFNVSSSTSNLKVRHGLGYIPKDVIKTRITGSGTLTLNYALFDTEFIDVSTDGPVLFRGFVGTYTKDRSQESLENSEEFRATVAGASAAEASQGGDDAVANNFLEVGNIRKEIADFDNILSFQAGINSGSGNQYGTFREQSATAGYVVPAGKRLRILWVHGCAITTPTGLSLIRLLYGTDDVGWSTTSEPASPQYFGIGGGNTGATNHAIGPSTETFDFGVNWVIPAAKYPAGYFSVAGGLALTAYGSLENA